MVKQRKERIGGEFIGFSAFAAPAPGAAASPQQSWSPVYTGHHDGFRSLFARLSQKSDSRTLTTALQDLLQLFQSTELHKRIQIDALLHYSWLYHTKLGPVEANSTVRAGAFGIWVIANARIPKAVASVCQKYPELLGMLYSAQADPSSEVRNAAIVGTTLWESKNDWPWEDGIYRYTSRILGYGRPSAMDSGLFPKRTNDPDRDQMEERFDRLVANSLDVLVLWFQKNPSCDTTVDLWWKTFGSSKATLRRKTYQLAATVAATSPSLAGSLLEHFAPALSSEKEANNMSVLLEALLTVLVKGDAFVDASLLKGLVKVFKKACYLAPVDQWGPMLLPIVAKIHDVDQQIQLLKASQTGMEMILTDADKWRLWTAISESAFICGRANAALGEIWRQGLEFALTTQTVHRNAKGPRDACLKALAEQLVQQTSLDEDSLNVMSTCPLTILTDFVNALIDTKPSVQLPRLKDRFHAVLNEYQTHSGASPSNEAYQFMTSTLRYQSPDELFEPVAIRSFVMNDLLRWAVLHTSSLSDHRLEESDSVCCDFELLALCLDDDDRLSLWEPFLKEILAAKADVRQLGRGLEVFVTKMGNDVSLIRTEVLDSYATDLAKDCATRSDDVFNYEREENEMNFFKLCMKERSGGSVVSMEIIEQWGRALPVDGIKTRSSSVLEAMTEEIIGQPTSLFPDSLVLNVAIASWLVPQGGSMLERIVKLLDKRGNLRSPFVESCGSYLRGFISSAIDDHALSTWPKRCILLWMCCTKWDRILPSTGLESFLSWQSDAKLLFQILLSLLRNIETLSGRVDFIRHLAIANNLQPACFLTKILLLLSDASNEILGSARSRLRKDRAALLLDEIFGSGELRDYGLKITKELIAGLSESFTFQHVGVLSQLLSHILPVKDRNPDEIECEEILENAKLWYIPDEDRPDFRIPVTVMKVHNDSITGYYFTIIVESREKQTLASRLRTTETSTDDMKLDRIAREEIRSLMMNTLSQHAAAMEGPFGDLVSVLIHQIGFGNGKGIGSPRFEILKIISSLLDRCLTSLSTSTKNEVGTLLFQAAMCLGFGFAVPGHFKDSELQKISLLPLAKGVASTFLDTGSMQPEVAEYLLPLLIAILPIISRQAPDTDPETFENTLQLLFRQVVVMLSITQSPGTFLLACRAINTGIHYITELRDHDILNDSCFSDAFGSLMDIYFTPNGTIRDSVKVEIALIPEFDEILVSLQHNKRVRSLWSKILRDRASIICQCLLETDDYYRMHLLLNACIADGVPLRDNDSIGSGVERILSKWIEGMNDEESAEVEVDLDICSKWIPEVLLLRLEKWDDEEDFMQVNSDLIVEGTFLWLSFLNFAQTAIPTDYRVRPAFVSFLDRCGALNHALNLSVLHDGWVDDMNTEAVAKQLENERIPVLEPSYLSSSVIFRTMAVFPSLTRRWWEENCPKVYVQPIQQFVENVVSPEILRRELKQIKSDKAFGEMTVSASLVSREIIATYVQDECKLKVVITVPKSFPLRSAEVDCSQTLGVPESRWKRWSLQIRQMLNNQGGSLKDALTLWKNNVDKEFDGVEPCPVCYSVLHVKTHKLPSLECSTCHNRFHFDCLTQWFRSSGKNQCVLCQQPWRGTRV